MNVYDRRIPDTAACFPWYGGSTTVLEEGFYEATQAEGAVLVSRKGGMTATSAYEYTYKIDFAGSTVRGDMDLRLLIARKERDGAPNITGSSDVVFYGLGDESSVEVTLASDLDNAAFTDAIVEFM